MFLYITINTIRLLTKIYTNILSFCEYFYNIIIIFKEEDMKIIEIILIGISLAMDAFAISICKGLKKSSLKDGVIISIVFALFQFIMLILGCYLGSILSNRIINYHSYFSSILLITIGILMINEKETGELQSKLNWKELLLLAIFTSIDAFVIGISLSFTNTNILLATIIIGIVTFIICLIGYFLGHLFNKKAHQYSNIIGGITLIILGIKLLF